jgi:hypothetical protein
MEQAWYLSGDKQIGAGLANLRAEHAIYLLAR